MYPILENDDSNRALMGAEHATSSCSIVKSKAPFIGTGTEYVSAA